MMKFDEMVDRIRLPIDEFRLKYARGSIEKDNTATVEPKSYSVQLTFGNELSDHAPRTQTLHGVLGHRLQVSDDNYNSTQHLFMLENGIEIVIVDTKQQVLLQCTTYPTPPPFKVEETVTPVVSA